MTNKGSQRSLVATDGGLNGPLMGLILNKDRAPKHESLAHAGKRILASHAPMPLQPWLRSSHPPLSGTALRVQR